ncbi:MAG TPA: threonine/serine exporter family protein [Xanthobacteraceae bacterium]|nr:threonine/serine exporter family protein [Xanthobacteraceae bacterium]
MTDPVRSAHAVSSHADQGVDPAALTQALETLMYFGALMLRAGNAAFRVRQWMGRLASAMGIDALAVHIAIGGGMTATARRGGAHVTLASEIAPLGINASHLGLLEHLARDARPGLTAAELAVKLKGIEAEPPFYSLAVTAAAVGAASGAFSFLNSGGPSEIVAAFVGGAVGQSLRSLLFRYRFNQYAVTTLSAVVASGVYVLAAHALAWAGLPVSPHAAGFISSALFLVPGFPLIAGLLDLMQHQIVAGITRLAYALMVLTAAAFGLCLVAAGASLTLTAPPPAQFSELTTLGFRALASFAGGCGFAILYNSTPRTVVTVGCLALVGNELRLAVHDAGMQLALATFLGALVVGLLASVARPWLREPRIALTVPGIIIMVPGTYAFQTVVLLDQGNVLAALEAASLGAFVVGAMALGLATARLASQRGWIVES